MFVCLYKTSIIYFSIIQWYRATWPRGTERHGTSWKLDETAYRSHWGEGGTGGLDNDDCDEDGEDYRKEEVEQHFGHTYMYIRNLFPRLISPSSP